MALHSERPAEGGGPSNRVIPGGVRRPEDTPNRVARQFPITIAILAKNTRERVRVALDEYQGHRLIDVRIVARLTEAADVWTPTKKGVALNVAHLPELARAFAEAEAKARALGLMDG